MSKLFTKLKTTLRTKQGKKATLITALALVVCIGSVSAYTLYGGKADITPTPVKVAHKPADGHVKLYQEVKAKQEEEAKAKQEEEARLADEAKKVAEEKAKASGSSTSNNNNDGVQWVGLAAHAKKYLGRTDLICDWLIEFALKDMGFQYITCPEDGTKFAKPPLVKYNTPYFDIKKFPSVSVNQVLPGDIIESPNHVEIYLGNGMSIHGGYGENWSTVKVARANLGKATSIHRPTYGIDTTPDQWWDVLNDYQTQLKEAKDNLAQGYGLEYEKYLNEEIRILEDGIKNRLMWLDWSTLPRF
jgi:hypothetical protein